MRRLLIPCALMILVVWVTPFASARTYALPGDTTIEATGPGGAVFFYDESGFICTPPSGSLFPLGETMVNCVDGAGDPAGSFKVTVVDTTPPALSLPDPITAEATGPQGASVSFSVTATDAVDPAPTVTCDHASGDTFPLGGTTVTCTASDHSGNTSPPGSFGISVVDTTPPVVTPPADVSVETEDPSGRTVTYPDGTATDAVSGSLPVTCSPPSGSHFDVGTTDVPCSATDGAGNKGTASFKVTVVLVDRTPPVLTVPGPITAEATGPGGAQVSFTVTATDNIDPNPTITCDHFSGDTYPLGKTTVTCRASDHSGNTSAPKSFEITIVDTTPPVIPDLPNVSAEATGPSGASVSYPPVNATDAVDGTIPATCKPASGSTFPLGATTVDCNATDAHGNKALPKSFKVTVTDTTPPSFSGVPGPITVEANGPAGSTVNYTNPTAVDLVDGPIPGVVCEPASGSVFPLGTTTVTCHATDSHGNTGKASFLVKVVDTTPPTLVIPADRNVYAETPEGISDSSPAVVSFVSAATAVDIVDPNPHVTSDLHSFLPVGINVIAFGARDASGNGVTREARLTVLPMPPAGTPPLPIPPAPRAPANVPNLKVLPRNAANQLSWGKVSGAVKYDVYRSASGARRTSATGHGELIYSGPATSYVDRGLTNGVEYRYVVVSVDAAGNQSVGVAIAAVPHRDLLKSPKLGATLRTPPLLTWERDAKASYYNVQLLRGGAKILSAWPLQPRLVLRRTWKFEGRKYTLARGVYTWYVWPGYGLRSEVRYGELLGYRSFRVTR
jgi:hypothetical protein